MKSTKMRTIAKKGLIIGLVVAVLFVAAQIVSEQYYAHSSYWIANQTQASFVANKSLPATLSSLWADGVLTAAAVLAFVCFDLTFLALAAINSSKLLQLKHVGEILLYVFLIGVVILNSYIIFAMDKPETDAGFAGLAIIFPFFFFIVLDAIFYLTIPFNGLLERKHPANKK